MTALIQVYHDKNNAPLHDGAIVRCPEGEIGMVRLVYGGWRVDVSPAYDGSFLKYVSSYLFNDHRGPQDFEVIS